jgi:hypothetical protein
MPREEAPNIFSVSPYARSVAADMYAGQLGQDDQQDAMRHMLAAGTLTRKYNPTIAELLGKAHEYSTSPLAALRFMLGRGQMPSDYEQDIHNNALGIELGQKAKTQTELEKLVLEAAEQAANQRTPGRAWIGAVQNDAPKTKYADGGAAFGVFPQMKARRAKQDRTASANAPLSALRGYAAGTAGLPGDIEGLLRSGLSQVPSQFLNAFPALRAFGIGSRADPTPQLPTTEFYNEYLPGAQLNQTPTGKAFTTAGNLLGGAGATTIAGLGAKGTAELANLAAKIAAESPRAGSRAAQLGVIKMPGGNFLKGEPESSVKGLKRYDYGGHTDPEEILRSMNLTRGEAERAAERNVMQQPINTFIDKKIVPYIKNEMATPDDPLRAMAEKYAVDKPVKLAEVQGRIDAFAAKMEQTARDRGVPVGDLTSMRQQMIGLEKEKALVEAREGLHFTPDEEQHAIGYYNRRAKAGTDLEGMGQSPLAKSWENVTDSALGIDTAGNLLKTKDWAPELVASAENPWLAKVPPETKVYSARSMLPERTGFDHLVDELRNATNPESGLPKNLLIDPADLGKLTMAQAVDRVADINAWRATQKAEADLARANNAATQLVKEYPEQGMKWVELKQPAAPTSLPDGYSVVPMDTSKGFYVLGPDKNPLAAGASPEEAISSWAGKPDTSILEDALKYEGDTMQHCVGGYCPDVVEGKSRIYSLRDDKGQPRVTIEVEPKTLPDKFSDLWDVATKHVSEESHGWERLSEYGDPYTALKEHYGSYVDNPRAVVEGILEYFPEALDATLADINNLSPKISQIKGFKNKKPADEYLPYIQDFVKSGKWSEVNELQNAGLRRVTDAFNENELKKIQGAGIEVPTWATPDEIKTIGDSVWPGQYGTPPGGIPEGMAGGGLVSNHFDPIRIKQIITSLDDEYDPERIQQIVAQRESAYA